MIEINLLSEELKVEAKRTYQGIGPKQFMRYIPLILGILVIAHIFLAGIFVIRNVQLSSLNKKWQKLTPERKTLEDFQTLSADLKSTQQLLNRRINWSEKLNKLSLYLPNGVWFNEMTITQKDFILKASVISLQKEEMNLINKFIDSLKTDSRFMKDFDNLELSSAQRKSVGGYDIIDFTLEGALKPK